MIYAENILLCIAIPMLLSLLFVRGNVQQFVGAFLVGMGLCLVSAYIDGYLNLISGMGAEETAIFISPIVEEIMKFLPLLFLLFLVQAENEGLVMAAAGIGTGFATFENCCYILSSGVEKLAYVMIRGMAVGVMHIVSVLALSLSLVIARRNKVISFPGIMGALSLSSTFHALYNLLVSRPGISAHIGYALPILSALALYLAYRRLRNLHKGEN